MNVNNTGTGVAFAPSMEPSDVFTCDDALRAIEKTAYAIRDAIGQLETRLASVLPVGGTPEKLQPEYNTVSPQGAFIACILDILNAQHGRILRIADQVDVLKVAVAATANPIDITYPGTAAYNGEAISRAGIGIGGRFA